MTAAGLDFVSGGRFTLGLGTSGPQVIEGWHGVPYDAPVGRTRELDRDLPDGLAPRAPRLPRQALHAPADERRHRPRQAAQADQPPGPGAHPDRDRRARPEERRARRRARRGLAAHLLLPGEGRPHLGRAARRGQGQAGPARCGPLDVIAAAPLAIGDDVTRPARPHPPGASRSTSAAWARAARTSTTTWPAGSATRARRTRIQDAYLAGRKDEAAALVPAELVEKTALIGPPATSRSAWRPSARPASPPSTSPRWPRPTRPRHGHRERPRPRRLGEGVARAAGSRSATSAYGLRATPP